MDVHISKQSEVPLRQQLTEQIIYLIATGKLRSGDSLPSVRELARRLKIHHNTISEAYQDLVRRTWLLRHRGSRLVVAPRSSIKQVGAGSDLDDLINVTIRTAREVGYSLQDLRTRVRDRLLAEPPDHILVVEEDPGLREIMAEEIAQSLDWLVEGCSRADLARNRGLAIGAVVVAGEYALEELESLVPKDRPPVALRFCAADEHVKVVRKLLEPSLVAVVSVSESFLKTARSVLAPSLADRHSLRELHLPQETPDDLRAFDLVFCDSVVLGRFKLPKFLHYRLIDAKSLDYLASAIAHPPESLGLQK